MKPIFLGSALGAAFLLLASRSKARPTGTAAERVVDAALREKAIWGDLDETHPLAQPLLRKYWQEGAGLPPPGPSTAWSAAFVSYVANKGEPGSLTPAGAHVFYAAQGLNAGPGQYRTHEAIGMPVRPGDILIKGRDGQTPSIDSLRSGAFIPTHGDIVVAVDDGFARAMGGNVANGVNESSYPLLPDGSIHPSEGVFAVMRIES